MSETAIHTPAIDPTSLIPWLGRPSRAARTARWLTGKLTGLDRVNANFRRAAAAPGNFFSNVMREFNWHCAILSGNPDAIPASGPLMIASNHPFGGGDAVSLGEWVTRIRGDLRYPANRSIHPESMLGSWMIPVEVFGSGPDAARSNALAARGVMKHWRNGGVIAAFPAAVVSYWQPDRKKVADAPWQPGLFELARRMEVPILPVYFEGQNSTLFQWLGRISPRLRSALLPWEGLSLGGKEIGLRIGALIPPGDLPRDSAEAAAYVRAKSEALSPGSHAAKTASADRQTTNLASS